MAYFTRGAFADDPWAGREILTLADYREREGAVMPDPLGLRLEPGVAVETLGKLVQNVALIAIAFPKFTDGRGYSMGWLLRKRLGYEGEMRAVATAMARSHMPVLAGFERILALDLAEIRP